MNQADRFALAPKRPLIFALVATGYMQDESAPVFRKLFLNSGDTILIFRSIEEMSMVSPELKPENAFFPDIEYNKIQHVNLA